MRHPVFYLALLACSYAAPANSAPAVITRPAAHAAETQDTLLGQLQHAHRLMLADQLDAAATAYRKLTNHANARAAALLGLAYIAQRQSHPAEADRLYRQALRLQPQEASAQAALILLLANGTLLPAISLSQAWSQHEPQQALAHALHGQLLLRARRPAEARLAYQKACQLDAGNPGYAYNLAVSLDQLQRYQEALSWYARSLQLLGTERPAADQPHPQFIQQRLQELRHWQAPAADALNQEITP